MRGYARASGVVALGLALALPVAAKPPSWDSVKTGASRFKVSKPLRSEAVLDRETGLVWTRSPVLGNCSQPQGWVGAVTCCQAAAVGGRRGWRLPRVAELTSLLEDPPPGDPALPAGHPFVDVASDNYWTATESPTDPANEAVFVDIGNGTFSSVGKVTPFKYWCVRGPLGGDGG